MQNMQCVWYKHLFGHLFGKLNRNLKNHKVIAQFSMKTQYKLELIYRVGFLDKEQRETVKLPHIFSNTYIACLMSWKG